MNNIECAYIAGIIDGEGSIMLVRFKKNQFPAPCVSIASTTYELLEWIKLKSGMGVIKEKKNYNKEKHKNSFTFTVKYNEALQLLEEIYPYLIIESKKYRAHLLITQYKKLTPRNGRYTPEQRLHKEKFYEKFIKIT